MFRTIVVILAASAIGFSYGSSQQSELAVPGPDSAYTDSVRAFVHSLLPNQNSTEPFILEDSVVTNSFPDFLESCLTDTVTFDVEERRQIRAWDAHPPFRVWTTVLIPQVQLIRKDTVRAIFSHNLRRGWTYFHDHYGRSLSSYGCPLFLRGGSYALFYSQNVCGALCGEGRLALYQRKGDQWVVIKTWGSWIS